MFSQNVFSAKDVLGNSSLCDSNMWDSQPYSQISSHSQNSQLSSMDLFSQHKESDQSKFDHYERSHSPNREDDPSNYYSKYANNPPLFHGSCNNSSKSRKSIKDMIEEQKRNISIREDRDMLQTFISLLKDYTKEVNSVFQHFKDYIEESFQEIKKSVFDRTKNFDDDFKNFKDELLKIIEKTDKESNEKEELKKNLADQTGTIKVLESKVEILEKQLKEANDKESAYVDQRMKYYQLEQKYQQRTKNWDLGHASFLGNTPPPSQNTDPLCTFVVPPLQNQRSTLGSNDTANYKLLPNQVPPSTTSYGLDLWAPEHRPADPLRFYNPQIMASFQMDSSFNPPYLYQSSSNLVPSATNCLYPTSDANPDFRETSHLVSRNSINYTQSQDKPNDFYQTSTMNSPSLKHKDLSHSGSNAHKSNLIVSRRSMKKPKPKPSPVAMVKPQLRRTNLPEEDELLDIFLCGIKENKNARKSQKTSQSIYDQKQQRSNKARNLVNENELVKVSFSSRKLDPDRQSKSNKAIDGNVSIEKNIDQRSSTDKIQETGVPHGIGDEGKSFRREESVRRKRSLVSMLGMSSDDFEVQEIANSIKAQQRKLAKRIQSLS